MGINPILALQGALGVLTAVFVAGLERRGRGSPADSGTAALPRHRCAPADVHRSRHRSAHEFLRHARHRLVRHDDRALSIPAARARRLIPGTLNVGHTLPTIAQAFIYTTIVQVDVLTLFAMIVAAVARRVARRRRRRALAERRVQIGMGAALLGAAALMLMTQLNLVPRRRRRAGVRGAKLVDRRVGATSCLAR